MGHPCRICAGDPACVCVQYFWVPCDDYVVSMPQSVTVRETTDGFPARRGAARRGGGPTGSGSARAVDVIARGDVACRLLKEYCGQDSSITMEAGRYYYIMRRCAPTRKTVVKIDEKMTSGEINNMATRLQAEDRDCSVDECSVMAKFYNGKMVSKWMLAFGPLNAFSDLAC